MNNKYELLTGQTIIAFGRTLLTEIRVDLSGNG